MQNASLVFGLIEFSRCELSYLAIIWKNWITFERASEAMFGIVLSVGMRHILHTKQVFGGFRCLILLFQLTIWLLLLCLEFWVLSIIFAFCRPMTTSHSIMSTTGFLGTLKKFVLVLSRKTMVCVIYFGFQTKDRKTMILCNFIFKKKVFFLP